MCCILRCFGWILDILQRALTFILACCMGCAICIGITVAISAGVAYGYNYSLTEFLNFKQSDITVYVRRGQFADKPELSMDFVRRSGGDTNDMFSSNASTDYQDKNLQSDSKPLADTWKMAQDTRNYADKLTKYSQINPNRRSNNIMIDDEIQNTVDTGSATDILITPTWLSHFKSPFSLNFPNRTVAPKISIDDNESGIRRIGVPKDSPNHKPSDKSDGIMNDFYQDSTSLRHQNKSVNDYSEQKRPDIKIDVLDTPKSLYLKSQHYNVSKYLRPDVDPDDFEDNIDYKSV